MTIEMYNNVPTSKDVSIIVDQYSLTAIEPATHRLIRLGYLRGGYSHQTLCIALADLLQTLGYYDSAKQMISIDKSNIIPKLNCKIRTLNNGVRLMRCITVDSLEDFLKYIILRSSNTHIKEVTHKVLNELPKFLSIIYGQHEILEQSLAYNIVEKLKADALKRKTKEAGKKLFESQPIFKVTLEETKHRKRRLTVT